MWYITVASLLLLSICTSLNGNNAIPKEKLSAGLHEKELKLADGQILRYCVYIPKTLSDEKVPLVLALHYGGKVTPYYSREYLEKLVIPAFEQLNAIIIAPDCPGSSWRDSQSEQAVLTLLDKSINELPINQARVVVTGYSMGGIGSWFIASRHPKRFCAAIPVSARPVDEPDGSVPFYVIHSPQDELFDLKLTEQAVNKLKEKGGQVELQVVAGISHYETKRFVPALSKTVDWLNKLWANK
ncbi:MAG: dienelactone hydrolase family protein [Acidobacteriota bacterium]